MSLIAGIPVIQTDWALSRESVPAVRHTHKNQNPGYHKRQAKKKVKLFGYREITKPGAYLMGGKLYVHPSLWTQLKELGTVPFKDIDVLLARDKKAHS